MKKIVLAALSALVGMALVYACSACSGKKEVHLVFFETSDVHGSYFPYDFIGRSEAPGGLARIHTLVQEKRDELGKENVILMDNGDILQGQPCAYYYNFIDTTSTHLSAAILNYMNYDVATMGNHDVEPGHAVYDRWVDECEFPVLGANAIDVYKQAPYWEPYTVLERAGVRIGVLGMVTPGIPGWLPESIWSGIRFEDMVETARIWIPVLKEKENVDVIIGLFHSGVGKPDAGQVLAENAATQVAYEVPGFDVIFCGHDHRPACFQMANAEGDSVWIVNPGAHALNLAAADMTFQLESGKVTDVKVKGSLIDVQKIAPDEDFISTFDSQKQAVRDFTEKVIGNSKNNLQTRPAFFGPSAFVDFIHSMQLGISGADISFVAPLSFDAEIPAGDIRVSDMFNLYKYENLLYVMKLSGQEIKDFMEYSYSVWTRQMKSADDHLLYFRQGKENAADPWQRLQNPSYNFDSAAGLIYEVDVTKPAGQKVRIKSLANGKPFSLKETYRVALNSYRGNGGGGHLIKGAGIPKEQLAERIVWTTTKDLRYYLMQEISRLHDINPQPLNQWKFVPEKWTKAASQRDAEILFK